LNANWASLNRPTVEPSKNRWRGRKINRQEAGAAIYLPRGS
jgi:hypothetical protein